jgi:DME family drug/metabolite transporter
MSSAGIADPAIIGLIRTALGALVLVVGAAVVRSPMPPLRYFPYRGLLVFGIAGAAFQICLFAAFQQVGVTVTVAVTVCAPVLLVAVADAVWQRQTPDRLVLIAIAVASIGVLLARPDGAVGAPIMAIEGGGLGLLAGASIAFAVLAVAARNMTGRLPPLRAAGLGLAATAVVLAGFIAVDRDTKALPLALPPGRDLLILAYVGVVATGGAYLAFVLGLQLGRSAAAGLAATLIEPGVAALLAAVILGEQQTRPEVSGCLLMLAAVVLLFAAERRAPTAT